MTQVFKKLTPKNDIYIDQSYIDAINFCIEDKDIYNVAISGNYGSGKSSFIETYKQKFNMQEEVLHISLARFDSMDGEGAKKELNNKDQKILEGKIINQLLHQINEKKIPLTIFKSKKNPKTTQILVWSTFITVFLLSSLFLLQYNNIVRIFSNIIPSVYDNNYLEPIAICILLISICFFIYKLVNLQFYRKLFKSISFKGAGVSGKIEILEDSKASYFDQYLDDVLYLFDNCQHSIVVFEDIDRFKTNSIFEKLKEINTLINNKRRSYLNDEKLIFMYLIKDDMFNSKERTKFFDFIVPIIPTTTSSNSREKFTEVLSELGCKDDLSSNFLQKISIYIDDMRLINNICNEFVLYKNNLINELEKSDSNLEKENSNKIEKLKLSQEKLFSMIVYKNVFPKDFSELQKDNGLIYRLFQEKSKIKKEKLSLIESKMEKLREEILLSESEFIENELELYSSILKVPDNKVVLMVNGKFEDEFENRLDFISNLIDSESEIKSFSNFYNAHYQQSPTTETMDTLFPSSLSEEFQLRLKNVRNKKSLILLKEEFEAIQEEKKQIQRENLANLISIDDINSVVKEDEFLYLEDSPQFSIFIFLIRNSYIDENYMDYITYFYPNSLRKIDKEFIMAVQGESPLAWDTELINLNEVYNRLEVKDFEQDAILNYGLFQYIITKNNDSTMPTILKLYFIESRLDFFISMMKEISNDTYGYQINLALLLLKYKPELIELLLESREFTNNEKIEFIHYFLFYFKISLEDLELSSIKEKIKNFISKNWNGLWEKYIALGYSSSEEFIKQNIEYLQIKIECFNFTDEYSEFSKFIYQNSLYSLNSENICSLLRYINPSLSEETIKYKNFSTIRADNKFEHLEGYVYNNFESYILEEILLSENCIKNKLEDIYLILNENKISFDTKSLYVKSMDENILDLIEIEDSKIIDLVLETNRCKFNTVNIFKYFAIHEVWNKTLVKFINSKTILNIDTNIFKRKDQEFQRNFFRETAKCNELENRHYKAILSVTEYFFTKLPDEEIDKEKISILIETGSISKSFDKNILIDLRSRYPKNVLEYNLYFLDGYIENIEDEEIYDEEELLELLENVMPISKARKLVDRYEDVISIKHKNYSAHLSTYILLKKFDKSDFSHILKYYSTYSVTIQNQILINSKKEIDTIIENNYVIEKKLLINLCKEESIDLEKRRLLFSQNISKLSEKEFIETLKSVVLYEKYKLLLKLLEKGGNPKVPVSQYNKHILDFLKEQKVFSSYGIKKNDLENYTIYNFKKQRNL